MKKSVLKQYIQEILSFSDDEREAIVEANSITFERLGQMMTVKIIDKDEKVFVEFNESLIPYKTFLAKELGRLDLMASKIARKFESESDKIYVDANALLLDAIKRQEGTAKQLLEDVCSDFNQYATKICFVTADAGHGKTVLLRQYQYDNAQDYLKSKSNYIFWHIDLHGRDLVRLNEAMMYEVGSLRLSGLYYNSILTLIRNGLLVLAIDGFDELAAEIGGEKVLGSLSNLVEELDGQGTLVAASRRTFFNTQDFLKRTRLLKRTVDQSCEFGEIKLQNWKEFQCTQYLEYFYDKVKAHEEFVHLCGLLGNDKNHPILERPFLFVKLVNCANDNIPKMTPSEFLRQNGGNFDSINVVIEAFIKREVEKWTYIDNQSGNPYLSFEQHVELLMEIANEMWTSQKNYISVEAIQYLTTILIDSWNIETEMRPLIIRMVESHAFLVIAENGDSYRRFDHDEFKDYFLACKLKQILERESLETDSHLLRNFLCKSQLQESVARYIVNMIDLSNAHHIASKMVNIVGKEWRPSYLQSNIGVLLPYLLDNFSDGCVIEISGKIVFSSIIFENKYLKNISFKDCDFINISLKNSHLENVSFYNCSFTDIRFRQHSSNYFSNVLLDEKSSISMVTVENDEQDFDSEYSPNGINEVLVKMGIVRTLNAPKNMQDIPKRNEFCKTIRRFLNKFVKSTNQYEENLRGDDQVYYSMSYRNMIDNVIPLLEKYHIIKEVHNNNTRLTSSRAWALDKFELNEIYKAEDDSTSSLFAFWEEARTFK